MLTPLKADLWLMHYSVNEHDKMTVVLFDGHMRHGTEEHHSGASIGEMEECVDCNRRMLNFATTKESCICGVTMSNPFGSPLSRLYFKHISILSLALCSFCRSVSFNLLCNKEATCCYSQLTWIASTTWQTVAYKHRTPQEIPLVSNRSLIHQLDLKSKGSMTSPNKIL